MELWWVYDIVTLGIIIICILAGVKRGFIKIVITVCGLILTFVVSKHLAYTLSPQIYDEFVHEKTLAQTEQIISKMDLSGQIKDVFTNMGVEIPQEEIQKILEQSKDTINDSILNQFAQQGITISSDTAMEAINIALSKSVASLSDDPQVSDTIRSAISSYINQNKSKTLEVLNVLTQEKQASALSIEQNYIKPVIIKLIYVIVFLLISIVMMIITKLLALFVGLADKVEVTHKINTIFGALFGLIEGIIIVLLIGIVIGYLSQLIVADKMDIFSDNTISQTKIFQYFYDVKVIE